MARRKAEEKKAAAPKTPRQAADARFAALERLAGKSERFRRPRDVLRRVRAVPTIFPSLDRELRVGGWPIDRVCSLHGPSNNGKTEFAIGLILSFLLRGHYARLLDLERTTPYPWIEKMGASVGLPAVLDHPGFSASKPSTIEDCVDEVREFCTMIGEGKKTGELPPDVTGLLVVDSARKLVPRKFFEKVNSDKSDGSVDGFAGRGAQMKAALLAAWLDELVPLLDDTGTAILFILRESEDVNADANDKKYGRDYKVGGGKGPIFDSSLVARVERSAWVKKSDEANAPVYGERHRVTVTKTKIAGKIARTQVAYFHSSNGELVPEGFDVARDVLAVAVASGVAQSSGGWFSVPAGEAIRKFNGENQAVKWLSAHPEVVADLDARSRATFDLDGADVQEGEVYLPAEPAGDVSGDRSPETEEGAGA